MLSDYAAAPTAACCGRTAAARSSLPLDTTSLRFAVPKIFAFQDPISVELPEELDPGAAQDVDEDVDVAGRVRARLVDAEVGEGLGRVERPVRDAEALVRQRAVVVVLLEHLPLLPVAAPPQLPVAEPAAAIDKPVAQGVVGGDEGAAGGQADPDPRTFHVLGEVPAALTPVQEPLAVAPLLIILLGGATDSDSVSPLL